MTLIGTTVGHIRITGALGKGGMGEVYLGYDETLKRKVALKAIRDEQRLDAETKARFLREARILSQLDHQGICRIHEFIEGDDSDFIVLELIEGRSLRAALGEGIDPISKQLIAEWIAEALVAAHAKGVAHRDLKPENVMLTNEGEVKLLDFGLSYAVREPPSPPAEKGRAKAGDEKEVDEARDEREVENAGGNLETVLGPGTPEDTLHLTRTIFRATAAFPGSAERSGTFALTEQGKIMGTIAYMSPEQARGEYVTTASDMYSFGLLLQELFTGRLAYDPGLKPMTMLLKAAQGETLPVTGVEPELTALLERLKTPAPQDRPTAAETLHRLRWIREKPRRLRRRLAAAALVLILVFGGLKYTYDLRRKEREAFQARREAEAVSEFLMDLFAYPDPEKQRGDTVTARELLDAGARKIWEGLDQQPREQARLMFTMGRVYRQLGLYKEALPLLEEALRLHRQELGSEDLNTANHLDHLAGLYHDLGEYEKTEPLLRRALEIREKALGDEHPQVAASLNNLAFHFSATGETEKAEPLLLRALEIHRSAASEVDENLVRSLTNLGNLYRQVGAFARAQPYLERAVEAQEKLLAADHPDLVTSLNNLAILYHEGGDTQKAEPLYLRTLEIFEKSLGPEHPNVATLLNNLAELYRLSGEYSRARPLYLRALEIQKKALGEGHPSYAATLGNLADLLSVTGENERAEPLYRRSLEIQEQAFGPDHPSLAIGLTDFATSYVRQGKFEEAENLFERSLRITEKNLAEEGGSPSERYRLAATLVGLGRLYRATASDEQAVASWERAVELMQPLTESSEAAVYLHTHSVALLYLDRVEDARPMVHKLLAKGWRRPEFLELCRSRGLCEGSSLRRSDSAPEGRASLREVGRLSSGKDESSIIS